MVKRSVYEIMLMNTVLYKLYEQQINYAVNIGYKIYKLKNELDEIEHFMIERWKMLFGENYNVEAFTEEEVVLYNTSLQVQIDINIYNLTVEEITNNNQVNLTLNNIETVVSFLTT